ncbi:unnamed protein product [Cyprideis torosa]|uniref:Uncharacterized protein n=1 Tax=Cyprideis torosa TaxID=163714 RepID=A0A7R8ZVT6_9CRUS|nr:unnamed protein product [Cyprideis torosa]CAG0911024.1 unnamed protein product [Cyprideis torosa]
MEGEGVEVEWWLSLLPPLQPGGEERVVPQGGLHHQPPLSGRGRGERGGEGGRRGSQQGAPMDILAYHPTKSHRPLPDGRHS